MVTGASTADLAVILIDARKGVLTQTRRHSYLVPPDRHPPHRAGGQQDGPGRLQPGGVRQDRRRLYRVRQVDRHRALHRRCRSRASRATTSLRRRANTPWYTGPTLIEHLETVEVNSAVDAERPFRMPVQWVNRPNLDFRGLFRPDRDRHGQARRCHPGAAFGQDQHGHAHRHAGRRSGRSGSRAVRDAICFADEIDCSRGRRHRDRR